MGVGVGVRANKETGFRPPTAIQFRPLITADDTSPLPSAAGCFLLLKAFFSVFYVWFALLVSTVSLKKLSPLLWEIRFLRDK